MQVGLAQCVNKGMQRDYSMDKASQEFAYENRNIRITTNGNNSFLSVTNEKSTIECDLDHTINGTILGNAVIGNYLVLFVKNGDLDIIYRIELNNTQGKVVILYRGSNLKFSIENPIECITSYEGDDVQKVYWVDGKSQPRYINIITDTKYEENETFYFTPHINCNLNVSISKVYKGTGKFTSGIVQYFITGYKEYGAESNILYESALYYVSPKNRGGEIGENQSCVFKIDINDFREFEGIRVYSMIRTSYNSTPEIKLVYESILNSDSISIEDTNTGIPMASTDLLFLNSNTITASTISAKDNTLFLGDIKVENLTENFKEYAEKICKTAVWKFLYKPLPILSGDNEYYEYTPNLDYSSEYTKYFKYKEWYRVGIQFKTITGEWSQVFGVKDIQCNLKLQENVDNYDQELLKKISYNFKDTHIVYAPAINCTLGVDGWDSLKREYNIIEWRIVVAEHTDSTRTIKSQGLILPTIFNIQERSSKDCYYTPIWNMGMVQTSYHMFNIEKFINENYKHTPISIIDPACYSTDNMLITPYETKEIKETESNSTTLYGFTCKITGDRAVTITTQDSVRIWIRPIISEGGGKFYEAEDEILITWSHRAFGQGERVCKEAIKTAAYKIWGDIKNKSIKYKVGTEVKTILIKDLAGLDLNERIFLGSELVSEKKLIESLVPFYYGKTVYIENHEKTYSRLLSYDVNNAIINAHKNEYFVDANVCNFLSPDLNEINEDLNFRIVGYTDIKNSISDYNITVENNVDSTGHIIKPAKYNFNKFRYSNEGFDNFIPIGNSFTGITSFPLWPYDSKLFLVHYWQHDGSISCNAEDGNKGDDFILKNKKFANMWYCGNTTYLDENASNKINISSVLVADEPLSVFNSFIYKKDYENLLIAEEDDKKMYFVSGNETSSQEDISDALFEMTESVESNKVKTVSISSNSTKQCLVDLGNIGNAQTILPGYNFENFKYDDKDFIYESFTRSKDYYTLDKEFNNVSIHKVSSIKNASYDEATVINLLEECIVDSYIYIDIIAQTVSSYVIRIGKDSEEYYESTAKRIYTNDSYDPLQNSLKLFKFGNYYATHTSGNGGEFCKILHSPLSIQYTKSNTVTQNIVEEVSSETYETINSNSAIFVPPIETEDSHKLWIGEFYTDYNETSFMGGNTDAAIQSNVFLPVKGIYENNTGYGLEGDTYYQRWDHLRIYPSSEDSVNQPIDALSIMVETHKNLDGDYRSQRGRLNTTTLTVENTNDVLNPVYSQSNNYFTFNALSKKFNDSYHPTLYTWTLPKYSLSTIDNWTRINLTSSSKLDDDKGRLTKIMNFNSVLYAFQENAIATINFNKQTTISTSDGTPVEIVNSGKVTGHHYLSTTQGCKNKWSVIDSPYGLYFIDSYNKSINVFDSKGIKSLSTINLFEDWIRENEKGVIWNPNDTQGFKSFYDPIHKEVYFVNDKEALCYNELLQQFTSFYDYGNLNTLSTINGHMYGIKNSNLHIMFEGFDYCNLFGEQKNYSMTYKINKDPFIDKTWTNIEYRTDVFEKGDINNSPIKSLDTFNTLEVWNEYQYAISDMSKAIPKFRIWRANIPRDTREGKGLNRIRNPWIMLKLNKTENTNKRMEFHDLLIKYLQ